MPPRSVQKAKSFFNKIKSEEFKKERSSHLWSGLTSPNNLQIPDLRIVCKDDVSIMTHQVILAGVSPFMRELLKGVSLKNCDDSMRSSQSVTIFLPDFKSEPLKRILWLLYDGQFVASSSNELEISLFKEMKFIWKNVLQIDVVKLEDRNELKFQNIPKVKDMVARTFEMKNEKATIREDLENRYKEVMDLNHTPSKSPDFALKTESVTEKELEKVLDSALKTPVRAPHRRSPEKFRTPTPAVSSRKRKPSSNNSELDTPLSEPEDTKLFTDRIKNILDSTKKMKKAKDVIYSVERVHVCLICNGTKNGKYDREASNLSFSEPRKLKEHYSKHFYDEGKIYEFFPPEKGNRNEDGSVKDHFGGKFRYQCDKKSRENPEDKCWKSKKQKCGYKELALHNCTDHELFEEILANDDRPEIQGLIDDLQEHSSTSKNS